MSDIFTTDTIAIALETKNKAEAILGYLLSSKGLPEKPTEWLLLFLVRGEAKKVRVNIRRQSSIILLQSSQNITSLNEEEVEGHDVVISKLIEPPDLETNPYFKTETGLAVRGFISYVACEFYRNTFDPSLIEWKIPRQPRDNYIAIKCESCLWQKTWKMLEYIASSSTDKGFAAKNFYCLAIDSRLISISLYQNLTEGMTKTDFIKELQLQNRKLRELDGNPFDIGSTTHRVVQQAMILAAKDGEFKKKYYRPMIDARTNLVSNLKNDHEAQILGVGRKKENRGKTLKK
jgi:hypothetical protein